MSIDEKAQEYLDTAEALLRDIETGQHTDSATRLIAQAAVYAQMAQAAATLALFYKTSE